MKKLVLAGFSLVAVGLLVLGSQTNVVGYQVVKTSQEKLVKETFTRQELLISIFKEVIQKSLGTLKINSTILYWIGFLYGLITLIPAVIITFILQTILVFLILEGMWEYVGATPMYLIFAIIAIIIGFGTALMEILIYPAACGKWFVERFGGSLKTFLEALQRSHLKASIGG